MKYLQLLTIPRSRMYRLIATLSLLVTLFSGNALRAQNPAYSFASQLGGTATDHGNDIATDTSGNIYVTGVFRGTADFDPGSGTANLVCSGVAGTPDCDIFVASYDASGNYRWAFRVGVGGENEGAAIGVDGSGNVVVTGRFMNTADFDPGTGTANLSSIGWSTFVARYSSTGNYLWAFKIGPYCPWTNLAIDANDNIVVTGSFNGIVDFNPGSGTANLTSMRTSGRQSGYTSDIFVAKYSSSGTYQWAFQIGTGYYNEYTDAVALDGSGNIYVTGSINGILGITSTSTVDFDPGKNRASLAGSGSFVAKYNSAGGYLWAFNIGGVATQGGNNIAVDGAGNVVVTGGFTGTADFNPGTGTANLTGISTNGSYDIFVARYTSSGGYHWAFTPSVGYAEDVTIDGNGDIFVTGYFRGMNDFDPGTGSASLPGNSVGLGGFVARYTASGTYQWAFPMVAELGAPRGKGVSVDGSGNIHITGNFFLTTDFDPSETTASLTSAGGSDIFIAQYTEAPPLKRVVSENMESVMTTAAPNPFTSDFTFRCDGPSSPARIEVVDMMGRVVESRDVDGAAEITLGEELPAGAYIVRMTQGEVLRQVMVRKVR